MTPRANFGTTWWGRSWTVALENAGSGYDSRIPRGRTYARKGAVFELELHPGHISSRVVGSTGELYRVDIAVRKLAETEWEQVADSIAGKAAHLAALLDGELAPGIVDDADAVDVRLLPRAADLRPDCTCPDWAEPCKHAAATCYVVASEMDRDPFALFLLRGKDRDELIEMVRSRRTGTDPSATGPAAGGTGSAVGIIWEGRSLSDPPSAPPRGALPRPDLSGPGRPAPWGPDRSEAPGFDTRPLEALARDAIDRAWAMLVDGSPSGLAAGARADLARRAAGVVKTDALKGVAERAGVSHHQLRAWAEAWRLGGDPAVSVVADDAWSTDDRALEEARERLVDAGYERRSVALNYDSLRLAGNVWLVLGPDGRWYRLTGSGKQQDLRLAAPPAADVADLVDPPGTTI
jgi:uncharacterized Zn finger protein